MVLGEYMLALYGVKILYWDVCAVTWTYHSLKVTILGTKYTSLPCAMRTQDHKKNYRCLFTSQKSQGN